LKTELCCSVKNLNILIEDASTVVSS